MAREQPFEVQLHPHTNVDIASCWGGLEYEHYTLEESAKTLPLKIFEAQPIFGRRVLTLHLEAVSVDTVNVLFSGNTFACKSRLDAAGIPGDYYEDGKEQKSYFRVLKDLVVSDAEQKQKFLDVLADAFKCMAIRVIIDKAPATDSDVDAFISQLRELPRLHFV